MAGKPKLSDRRRFLITRIAALVRNLEKAPENFTLDKTLERFVARLEKAFKHHSQTTDYRAEAAKKRIEAEERRKKAAEADAAQEESDGADAAPGTPADTGEGEGKIEGGE